jgi:cobalt-zinc-cadmium efflux system outer membrane protein
MRLYTNLLLILFVTFLSDPLWAGESRRLPGNAGLEDYIAVGLAENPGLRSDYQRYQAALERIPQAKSLPDPRVSATQFIEEIQTRTGPQRSQLMLSQTFPWFGKLRLRGEVASKEAEAIYHEYENLVLVLIRDITLAYYDYAYLGKSTEITEEIIGLLERLEETVQQKVRGGGDRAPLLRLQVEIGKNKDILQTLEKERGRQEATVNALLNRREESGLSFPALPDPLVNAVDRGDLVVDLLTRNPELRAFQSRVEKADRAVQLAKKSPIPDPTVGATYMVTGPAVNPGTPGSGDNPFGVQLSFSIPLWFGKYKAEKREAIANEIAIKSRLEDRENDLIEALEKALEDLKENEDRVALYTDTLLPKAREAVEVTEASYSGDRATILDFIDSERTLLELENAYWRAVAEQFKSRVRLETLTGGKR